MSLRVTSNSMVRNYNSSLNASINTLNKTREKVYSGKEFNRAYQDPTGARRVSELRRKSDKIDSYLSNLTTAQSRQDTADSALQQMVTLLGETANNEGLKAMNASTEETRKTYATTLRELQKTLLQSSNTKYGDSYLFAGADGANLPFELDANGKVTYRNQDVNDPNLMNPLYNEKLFMDLGMGLQIGNGGVADSYQDINEATAYNAAICGLKTFGFGTKAGTNPPISKNAIELLGQMADELEKPNFDADRFSSMRDQLLETHSSMSDYNAELGVRSSSLDSTKERLEDEQINIIKQIDSIETAQPAAAITDYSYAQYVHNLVLKVGSSLLTNSFIDFMK